MLSPAPLLRQQLPILAGQLSQMIQLASGEALAEGELRLAELSEWKRSSAFLEARTLLQTISAEAWGEESAKWYWKEAFSQHLFAELWWEALPAVHKELQHNAVYSSFQSAASVFWQAKAQKKWLQPLHAYSDYILDTLDDLETEAQRQAFLNATWNDFYAAWAPSDAKTTAAPASLLPLAVRHADFLLKKYSTKNLADSSVLDATGDWLDVLLPYFAGQSYPPIYCNHAFLLSYYGQSLRYPQASHVWVNTPEQCRYGHSIAPQATLFAPALSPNSTSIEQENQQQFTCIFAHLGSAQLRAFDKRTPFSALDKRIKDTFLAAASSPKQQRLQDPSVRYFRWLLDRMGQQGLVIITSPKTLLEQPGYEGLRACLLRELTHCYVLEIGDWLIWGLIR